MTVPAANSAVASLPTISGTGTPGATIRAEFAGYPQSLIASVRADGTWSVANPVPLTVGNHTMTVYMDGPGACQTSIVVPFTITQGVLMPPTITMPPAGSTVTTPQPLIGGTGMAMNTVHVCIVGVECADVPVLLDGTWSFIPTVPLTGGQTYSVTAYQTDVRGQQSNIAVSYFSVA